MTEAGAEDWQPRPQMRSSGSSDWQGADTTPPQAWLEVLSYPASASVSLSLSHVRPLPPQIWHSRSPERGGHASLPVTTPWVSPGPQSLVACPVHLTSVWVVCYMVSSRNLMPSSQRICLVDFQPVGQGCLPTAQSLTDTPQHSQAAAGGCPLQSQDLAAEGPAGPSCISAGQRP